MKSWMICDKFVPFGNRLNNLKSSHPDVAEAGETIKNIGNGGAHGDKVEQDKLLACYELLEIELRKLFSNEDVRRRELIDGLKK